MTCHVTTQPAGHRFEVDPGETVLAAALRQGVRLPYACRNGLCGSCSAELISGELSYPSGQIAALADQRPGTCLTCQAVPETDLELRVAELDCLNGIEVRTLPCRVAEKTRLNADVWRLRLKLPEGQRLAYLAGQYLEFVQRDGRRRAFSIANPPHDDKLIELHLRRVPGGYFTEHTLDHLKEKTILRIQAPLGSFVLREQSPRPILMMAGGTGFAPIKAMIEHAFHIRLQRPIALYWGVRGEADLYLRETAERWQREHAHFSFRPVLSEPPSDWHGRAGWVHAAVLDEIPDLGDHDIYISGPPAMVQAARAACERAGVHLDQLFSDAFEFAADTRP